MKVLQLEGHGILGYQSELTVQECIILKDLCEQLNAIVDAPTPKLELEDVMTIRNAAVVIGKMSGSVLSMAQSMNDLFDIPNFNGVDIVDNLRKQDYSK